MGLAGARHARTAATVVLALFLTGGCGSVAHRPPGGLEKTHLTVGVLPLADDAPLFLAIKRGFFQRQGLTVTPEIITQNTPASSDLLRGAIDIADGSYVSYFESQARGSLDVRVLVAGATCRPNTLAILVMPGSGITGPAALAGRAIAVDQAGNFQALMASELLRADGVNPATVTYAAVSFPRMAAALKANQVDAISVAEPFLTSAEAAVGATPVMSECAGPTADFPLTGYFATAAWTHRYPRTARAFQGAMIRAQALADTDPAAPRQMLPAYTGVSAQMAPHIQMSYFPTTLNGSQLQRVANLMRSAGLIKSRLDVRTLLFH